MDVLDRIRGCLLGARVTAGHASGTGAGKGDGAPVGPGRREATVEAVRRAYLRWLDTQQHHSPPDGDLPHRTGRLREEQWLYSRRAPGNACLSGLHRPFPGPSTWGAPGPVNSDSKGCGTVMRSAPFGLLPFPSYEEDVRENAGAAREGAGAVQDVGAQEGAETVHDLAVRERSSCRRPARRSPTATRPATSPREPSRRSSRT
ncbi:ADP-ribosylglycohydrolase family protein [Nonomuraea sp. NPDC050404]|uniref:ADP-ribosylglycohydrolase family protein n=1 Tax=Nonomuraea sp. NPDC050404 TaxID=3155783 RepID=UPI0033FCDDBE